MMQEKGSYKPQSSAELSGGCIYLDTKRSKKCQDWIFLFFILKIWPALHSFKYSISNDLVCLSLIRYGDHAK